MCALTYLRQLLWIAKQQQVCGRGRHGDGIGQAELASLVDHQQIQAGFRHPIAVGEVPRRAADHASGGVADEFCVLAPVDRLPAPSGVVVRLFGDLPRVQASADHTFQQVLHRGVRLGDNANTPGMLGDQLRDHPGRGVRLAGPRRAVHRQV